MHLLGVQGRVATLQSLSGTGSLRVGAEFISKFLTGRTVYLSNPTWCAHQSSNSPCCVVPSLGMQEARNRLASIARPRVDCLRLLVSGEWRMTKAFGTVRGSKTWTACLSSMQAEVKPAVAVIWAW